MPTPNVELYAVRGTDFIEVIAISDENDEPADTTSAQALFILRDKPRGVILMQKDETNGVTFNNSDLVITITESELDLIDYHNLYYDLFLHLNGDVKKKILRGKFTIE